MQGFPSPVNKSLLGKLSERTWEHKERQYTHNLSPHFWACHGDKRRRVPVTFFLCPPTPCPKRGTLFFWVTVKHMNLSTILDYVPLKMQVLEWWTESREFMGCLHATSIRLQKQGLGPKSNPAEFFMCVMCSHAKVCALLELNTSRDSLPKSCRFCLTPAPGDSLFPPSPWVLSISLVAPPGDDDILPSPSAGALHKCLVWA